MRKIYLIISLLPFVFGLSSCSLEEDSSSITDPYQFFETEKQIRAALNGCYDPMNRIFDLRYFIAVEGATDLGGANNSAQPDAKMDINPSNPGAGTNVWQYCWYGLRYCLSTKAGIERSSVSESVKQVYYAECMILTSFYYYILTSFFGDVPFYLDYIENEEDLNRVAKMGRMSATATRDSLITILNDWVPVMDQVRTYDVKYNDGEVVAGYMGAATGWMMIAKLAAWNKDWDEVLSACGRLVSIYGSLTDYSFDDVCWRNKNTPESIFEIQHYYVAGGIDYCTQYNLSVATVVTPYPKKAGTCVYDSVTIEELGDQATVYTPVRPTVYFKSSVFPSNEDDVRRPLTIVSSWDGASFPSSRSWLGPKFWCPAMYQAKDNNDYKIFRYADAVLLMAEAYCELGDYESSLQYLNMVRSRAHIEPYVFETAIKLRGEIRDERGRELFGEFQRKYDLVRWGIWYDQVSAYNLYTNLQNNIRPCHEYYPIPDQQVERSGGILTNDEYKKYGL